MRRDREVSARMPAYREMAESMESVGPLIMMSMARPPVSFGNFVSFSRSSRGQELILAMMEHLSRHRREFDTPKVQMHFLKCPPKPCAAPRGNDREQGLFLIGASHSHPAGAVVGGPELSTMVRSSSTMAGR